MSVISILSIDDSLVETDLLIANLLISHHYTIIESTNIDRALKQSKNINTDLILCNLLVKNPVYIMPHIREINTKFKINSHTKNCPIIAYFYFPVIDYYLHKLAMQEIYCCFYQEENKLIDNESELLAKIKYLIKSEMK